MLVHSKVYRNRLKLERISGGDIKGEKTIGFKIWSVNAAGLVGEGEQYELVHRAEKEEATSQHPS